jgi:hypothetical protein
VFETISFTKDKVQVTDLAQPIRVVQDSCVKGWANKMLAHLLCILRIQLKLCETLKHWAHS